MKRKTCLVPLCAAAALIVSQMSGGALADAGKEAEAQSVRPTNPEIRTSVNQLLGWRVGVFSSVFPNMTFVQSVTLADALGLASIGGDDSEQVSPENGQKLDFQLSPDNLAMVKAHLAAARVRMTAYRVHSIDRKSVV